MPQTNNLELMTYVSLGICFWVAIAANPLTIWEETWKSAYSTQA